MRGVHRICVVAVAAAMLGSSSPAGAQDFFDALFGPDPLSFREAGPARAAPRDDGFRRRRFERPPRHSREVRREVRRVSPPARNVQAAAKPDADNEASWGGGFCVRTCDGYYFPLIKSERATKQQSCEYACPFAPMAIYEGATIESARNYKGQKYASLPTAFSSRDRTTPKCSCYPAEYPLSALQRLIRSDPTLHTGDIVFETDGAFVYRGSDFAAAERSTLLSPETRRKLRILLVAGRLKQPPRFEAAAPVQTARPVRAEARDESGEPAAPATPATPARAEAAPERSAAPLLPLFLLLAGSGVATAVALRWGRQRLRAHGVEPHPPRA